MQASLAASNGAGGGPKKRLGDAVGWFKGLGQAATCMVGASGGRAADAAEDPEYIKVGWGSLLFEYLPLYYHPGSMWDGFDVCALPEALFGASGGCWGGGMGGFKGLGKAATSMVGASGGRAADAADDPEYIKVDQYFLFVKSVGWSSWLAMHTSECLGTFLGR
jgi:hypothetical protein